MGKCSPQTPEQSITIGHPKACRQPSSSPRLPFGKSFGVVKPSQPPTARRRPGAGAGSGSGFSLVGRSGPWVIHQTGCLSRPLPCMGRLLADSVRIAVLIWYRILRGHAQPVTRDLNDPLNLASYTASSHLRQNGRLVPVNRRCHVTPPPTERPRWTDMSHLEARVPVCQIASRKIRGLFLANPGHVTPGGLSPSLQWNALEDRLSCQWSRHHFTAGVRMCYQPRQDFFCIDTRAPRLG